MVDQTNTAEGHGQSANVGASIERPNTGFPVVRAGFGGVLMGLANLVPGVSGGTMMLVMGLYDEFITSIADITRCRFHRRNILFLAVVGCAAVIAIAVFSGMLSRAVTLHRSAMYSVFIGLTLGGAPLLVGMLKRTTAPAIIGVVIGLAGMVAIAATKERPPDRNDLGSAVVDGTYRPEHHYALDVTAGALGMSAMVLPGVSGAYMLLILDRYEPILASVASAKAYVLSVGREGNAADFLRILLPAAIGAIASLVVLSNLLKWMLHRFEKLTLGVLLGILLGSIVGIWPFHNQSTPADYSVGAAVCVAGFFGTFFLGRIKT